MKKSNQTEQGNQRESQKPENLDNRLPDEALLLRKHGRVYDGTNLIFINGFDFDGFFGYGDSS